MKREDFLKKFGLGAAAVMIVPTLLTKTIKQKSDAASDSYFEELVRKGDPIENKNFLLYQNHLINSVVKINKCYFEFRNGSSLHFGHNGRCTGSKVTYNIFNHINESRFHKWLFRCVA